MKNIRFLLVLLTLFFSVSLFSQTYDNYNNEIKRIQIIAKGGLNITNVTKMSGEGSGKEKVYYGYNAGLTADIYIGKGLYLQPGVMVTTKGARLRNATFVDGQKVSGKISMMYVKAPLLLAFKIPVWRGEQSFNFALGPYYAYGIDGDLNVSGLDKVDTFGKDGLCKESEIGIDVEVQFEARKFMIYCGAETGLTRLMKKESMPSDFKKMTRNYAFYLGAGYKF